MKTKMVFICSPYRGNIRENVANARRFAKFAAMCGYSPVVPHLLFPQFLDDEKADERIRGIELGIVQMKKCDEMWIFGTTISQGMSCAEEINSIMAVSPVWAEGLPLAAAGFESPFYKKD